MENSEVSKINKEAWEKIATIHQKFRMEDLLTKFSEPGFILLDSIETSFLKDKVKVKSKDVIQLCCNNARELLSVKNLGANRCVGIDLTEGFIAQGRELAHAAHQELELYTMDVFTIPESFNNSFDVVYITVGALVWLQNLKELMNIVNRLLKTKGLLLLYDLHPIFGMFEPSSPNPIVPFYSYFKSDPYIEEEWSDYFDKQVKMELKNIGFQHTLEEIFMSCLDNDIQIREYREYGHDISEVFKMYEKYRFPMSYILLGQKI